MGGANGEFYSLDLCCQPLVRWRVQVRGVVRSAPVSAFGRIYLVTDGGMVYCVGPADKSLRWSYSTCSAVEGGLHVDESGVYVASANRRLSVLDPDTGARIAHYRFPSPLTDTPTVVQRTVYQYSQGDGLYAFDVDTRDRLWINPEARRLVARAAEDLVLLSESGGLLLADNSSGVVGHRLALPEDVIAVTNPRDAVLYLVASDGRMQCAKPQGFPYLRREAFATARARLGLSPAKIKESIQELAPGAAAAESSSEFGQVDDPLRSRYEH